MLYTCMLWLHILNYKCDEKNKIKYVLPGYYGYRENKELLQVWIILL
jgi:hypothetical protein